jgi:hypothetical protein
MEVARLQSERGEPVPDWIAQAAVHAALPESVPDAAEGADRGIGSDAEDASQVGEPGPRPPSVAPHGGSEEAE